MLFAGSLSSPTLKARRVRRGNEYISTSSPPPTPPRVTAPTQARRDSSSLHDRVGKRIAVIAHAMCQVGAAALAACVCGASPASHTLPLRRRRTLALAQVAR